MANTYIQLHFQFVFAVKYLAAIIKTKTLILLLLIFSNGISFAQSNRYHVIDSLLQTRSLSDGTTAMNKLKEMQQAESSRSEYWAWYSKASFATDKDEEAKAGIRKAINLDPGNAKYYFEKGILYNELHQLDTASKAFEQAIAIRQDGEYYYWKGIVNHQLGNKEIAEKDYRNAIDNKFETAELFNNLSILLMEKENYKEALPMINKALLLDKNYAQAYSARARINFFLLNIDPACEDKNRAQALGYKKAFEIPDSVCNGTNTQKIQFAADMLAYNKFYKQALEAYSKLIADKVLTSHNFLNRGYCYFKQKDYANAEKDYLRAMTLPNLAKDILYDNLSLLYFEQDQFQKSIEYSTKRIELNPQNHVPYIDRGLCYRILKKYKEAENDFDKSLSIKPDFHRAFGYRSSLYFELGQYQKALEDASKAVQINSRYGYGYMRRAEAKQALSMPDFCLDLYYAQKYGESDAEAAIKKFCK